MCVYNIAYICVNAYIHVHFNMCTIWLICVQYSLYGYNIIYMCKIWLIYGYNIAYICVHYSLYMCTIWLMYVYNMAHVCVHYLKTSPRNELSTHILFLASLRAIERYLYTIWGDIHIHYLKRHTCTLRRDIHDQFCAAVPDRL